MNNAIHTTPFGATPGALSRWICTIALLSAVTGGCLSAEQSTAMTEVTPSLAADTSSSLPRGWTSNDAMMVFFQIAGLIDTNALNPLPVAESVRNSIDHLLSSIDPYAEYLSPDEYQQWMAARKESYAGVGMDLRERTGRGGVICIPYPDSPALAAGIREGDLLLEVDGEPVGNLRAREVALMIRGQPHSEVTLTFQRQGLPPTSVPIRRTPQRSRTVSLHNIEGTPALRIFAFEPSTPSEILDALNRALSGSVLLIDISGNQGGDLYAAIDAARMFLDEEQEIVTVEGRKGQRVWRTENPGVLRDTSVRILVDRHTASAAEVFAAALLGNSRARLFGEPTYGKGLTQHVFSLTDGGALILTDGHLLGPSGLEWNRIGLPVSGSASDLLTEITE